MTDKNNHYNQKKNNGSKNIGNNNYDSCPIHGNNCGHSASQCRIINSAKDDYSERKNDRSIGNQSTGQTITVKDFFPTITIAVVYVVLIKITGVTITTPTLIAVWKIQISANHPIMEMTTIIM